MNIAIEERKGSSIAAEIKRYKAGRRRKTVSNKRGADEKKIL